MANSNEYMREYMLQRWHKRRAAGIEQLGGKCVHCETTENLQFDHINALDKSFYLSKMSSCSEVKWKEELSKCQLLCKDCHLNKTISAGDLCDRERLTICDCGRTFETIRSYAGHKRWCK